VEELADALEGEDGSGGRDVQEYGLEEFGGVEDAVACRGHFVEFFFWRGMKL